MGPSARARCFIAIACVLTGAAAADPSFGQSPAPPNDADAQKAQLQSVEKQLQGSEEERRRIQADLTSLAVERERLTAQLVDSVKKTRATEDQVGAAESRLASAQASELAIRQSLMRRKTLIALVLASLQRMGRKPLPAVLVDPQDMLRAIRTSMLLGSILPEMHQEVESLASDLADLSNARAAVAAEKDRLATILADLTKERQNLQTQIDARQAAQDKAQKSLADETAQARELAKQAADIKDLIGRMESGRLGAPAHPTAAGGAPGALGELFSKRKGQLDFPVAGARLKAYGEPDGFGASETGDSFAAVPGAVVSAPADSTVAYSGPYRTYGQLLILNAGEGYYLVMAGMDRIDVDVGQSVVAGEPVAVMGDGATKTAATIAVGAAQPVLYVEFRKDGSTIDPGPWWAKPELEKARG